MHQKMTFPTYTRVKSIRRERPKATFRTIFGFFLHHQKFNKGLNLNWTIFLRLFNIKKDLFFWNYVKCFIGNSIESKLIAKTISSRKMWRGKIPFFMEKWQKSVETPKGRPPFVLGKGFKSTWEVKRSGHWPDFVAHAPDAPWLDGGLVDSIHYGHVQLLSLLEHLMTSQPIIKHPQLLRYNDGI